jgi:hypothetical protein
MAELDGSRVVVVGASSGIGWVIRAPAVVAFLVLAALDPGCHSAEVRPQAPSLAGTWRLEVADKLLPDGTRAPDYGAHPEGRLMIDDRGRYALEIFQAERPDFASGDKAGGTNEEFRAAGLGSSCHHGTVQVDWPAGTLTFAIENATFPNWRGRKQVRPFELHGDVLSYRVPPRRDGSIAISVWRREP